MIGKVVIRSATEPDVATIRAILAAHGNDGPVVGGDVVGPYVRHLIASATAVVAVVDGEVVAFGAAVDAGVAVHLADLFVRPDRVGQGIGARLLAAVLADRWPRTTFASADPRAAALYVRAGMTPLWPVFYLEGDGSALGRPGSSVRIEAADHRQLAELEMGWTGVDRRPDHAFWASLPEADPFVVLDADEVVAFAYARVGQRGTTRVVDRLLVGPDVDPVPPSLAAAWRAARGGPVALFLAGPSPVLPVALGVGFRITEHDLYCASEAGLMDPARLLPNPGML